MKASNPTVMVAAYRLLAAYMEREGMDYPFHLGVTEAGNGEDARVKSAAGIGALLLDGIGDTIRVSLAEEPEEEVPVARALAAMLPKALVQGGGEQGMDGPVPLPSWNPLAATRRRTRTIHLGATPVGGDEAVAVLTPSPTDAARPGLGPAAGPGPRTLPLAGGAGAPRAPRPDAVTIDVTSEADLARLAGLAWRGSGAPRTALLARGADATLLARALADAGGAYLVLAGGGEGVAPLAAAARKAGKALIVESSSVAALLAAAHAAEESGLHDVALALRADGPLAVLQGYRLLVAQLDAAGLDIPLHLRFAGDEPLIPASAALGALLCDGLGDMAAIARSAIDGAGHPLVPLTFNLLQATRRRITKTDYVACPSCGRTLFDLQSTTEKVKERTAHLVGVKIAIMGCVVNGPGEMADADFGYVGGAPGKVNLYVGKECVERNVPEEEAADRLVALIKARGRWVEESANQDQEIA
jgi:(E)-4-hydroxy-3-methylbut-2-enyl-diphosphate synthase